MNDKLEELRARAIAAQATQATFDAVTVKPTRGQSTVVAVRIQNDDYNELARRAQALGGFSVAEYIRILARRDVLSMPA